MNKDCPCKRKKCERYGKCDLCREHHAQKRGYAVACERKDRKSPKSIIKNNVKNEFSEKIGRLSQSRAYLDFCGEVYGYRACMFNMMDKEQMDYLLGSDSITATDMVLDIGCGNGSVLKLLEQRNGCSGIGVDTLDYSFNSDERVKLLCGDIDALSELNLNPDVVISVDSLYFSADLQKLINNVKAMKARKFLFFFSQYLFDENSDRTVLESENTVLAKALENAGMPFRTLDFSENERALYERMLTELRKRRSEFCSEGNADLYEQKLMETEYGIELFRKGLAKRYLYTNAE